MIKEISSAEFEEAVLKNEKVLVDFNASWCGPCQMLGEVLNELAAEREDLKIVSVDIDECDDLAEKYAVASIPCLVIFENGKETMRKIGMQSKKKILKMMGEK